MHYNIVTSEFAGQNESLVVSEGDGHVASRRHLSAISLLMVDTETIQSTVNAVLTALELVYG